MPTPVLVEACEHRTVDGRNPHNMRLSLLYGPLLYGPTPVDPLLLLAVVADLNGDSQAQDEQIATLFPSRDTDQTQTPSRHLEELLSGPLKVREHARRLLEKMAANAKSRDLANAIRALDPTLVPTRS